MTQMRTFAALVAALALAGCDMSDDSRDSKATLRIAYVAEDGARIEPVDARRDAVIGATQLGLTAFQPDGGVAPSLASSWRVSEDGLSYVFKLREAYWTDGRRLTAGDVVAVIRRIVAPGSRNPLRQRLTMIENAPEVMGNRRPVRMLGIDDPRPDTVVIRLRAAEPALLQLLAHPLAAIVRAGNAPPASGPFTLAESDDDLPFIRLVRNGAYFGADDVSIGSAELHQEDAASAVAAFGRGEFDVVTGATIAGMRAARSSARGNALRVEPALGVYFYLARTSTGPLADIRVRRALAMIIERRDITLRMFGMAGMQPAYGALPPTLAEAYAGSAAEWAQWTREDREAEAVRLMLEAGYGLDRPLELSVAIPHGREHADILAQVANDWSVIGVRVKAFARGPIPHRRAIERGEYDLAVVEHVASTPIPDVFIEPFTCAVRLGGYCNTAVDDLLQRAAVEADPGTRVQLQRRANRLISEDAPLIAVMSPVRWSLVAPNVGGWQENAAGIHPLAGLVITAPGEEN